MQKIKDALPKRETGQATRVLIDSNAPDDLKSVLKKTLDIYNTDIILGGVYHNFKDFFTFPNPTNKKFTHSELEPLTS